MATSSLGFNDEETDLEENERNREEAMPLLAEDRGSPQMDSPEHQLAAPQPVAPVQQPSPPPAQPVTAALPPAALQALDGVQTQEAQPTSPAVTPAAPKTAPAAPQRTAAIQPPRPNLSGAENPQIGQAIDDLYAPPADPGPLPRPRYADEWIRHQAEAEKQAERDRRGKLHYLKAQGVQTEIDPDGNEVIALHPDGAPRWSPKRSEPYLSDDGTWRLKFRNERGEVQDLDLASTNMVHTDPRTGEKYFLNEATRQPVGIGYDDSTVKRLDLLQQRQYLREQQRVAGLNVADLRVGLQDAAKKRNELAKQSVLIGDQQNPLVAPDTKPIYKLESEVKNLRAQAPNIPAEGRARLAIIEPVLAKWKSAHPEYDQLDAGIKDSQRQIASWYQVQRESRARALALDGSPLVGFLPERLQSAASADPTALDGSEIEHRIAAIAGQSGASPRRILPSVIAQAKAQGVQTINGRPIDDVFDEAKRPPSILTGGILNGPTDEIKAKAQAQVAALPPGPGYDEDILKKRLEGLSKARAGALAAAQAKLSPATKVSIDGNGILQTQGPVAPGTEDYEEPVISLPPADREVVDELDSRLAAIRKQEKALGQPGASRARIVGAEMGPGFAAVNQFTGLTADQAAGLVGLAKRAFGVEKAPGDLESKLSAGAQTLREGAAGVEGPAGSVARGSADVVALMAGNPSGKLGTLVGALRAGAGAYSSVLQETKDPMKALKAAAITAPVMGLFMLNNKLAAGFVSRLVAEDAPVVVKALAGFGGAEVANVGTSAVIRAAEAKPGERLSAAAPTVQSLTADTLFAAHAGFGIYEQLSPAGRQHAADELQARGFTQQQIDDAKRATPPAATPAEALVTPPEAKPGTAPGTAPAGAQPADVEAIGNNFAAKTEELARTESRLSPAERRALDEQKKAFRAGLSEGDVLEVTTEKPEADGSVTTTTRRFTAVLENGRLVADDVNGKGFGLEPDSGDHLFNSLYSAKSREGISRSRLRLIKGSGGKGAAAGSEASGAGTGNAATPEAPHPYVAKLQELQNLRGQINAARDDSDLASVEELKEHGVKLTGELHQLRTAATSAVPPDVRAKIALAVAPGYPPQATEARLNASPDTGFGAAEVGRQMRPLYTTPESDAAVSKLASEAGISEPLAQHMADQHVGMAVGRDLARVAKGESIDAPRAQKLAELGLLQEEPTDTGSVMRVTDDALPLLPPEARESIRTDPDRFNLSVTPGAAQDAFSTFVQAGQERFAQAVNQPKPAPAKPFTVHLNFTSPDGNPLETRVKVNARDETDAIAQATAKLQRGKRTVTGAEVIPNGAPAPGPRHVKSPESQDYIAKGGWKLHLTVKPENYTAVDKWLDANHPGQYKHLHGGDPGEKDFTVYVGDRKAAEALAAKIHSEIGDKLEASNAGSEDALFTDKVAGRFDPRGDQSAGNGYRYYGRDGLPYDEEAANAVAQIRYAKAAGDAEAEAKWRSILANHEARIHNDLTAKFGDRFTGEEAEGAPTPADDVARNKADAENARRTRPVPVKISDIPLEARKAVSQVAKLFSKESDLFKALGIDGMGLVRHPDRETASGIQVLGSKLLIDGEALHDSLEELSKAEVDGKPVDPAAWVKQALKEEIVHAATMRLKNWQERCAAAWTDPQLSEENRQAAHEGYGKGFDELSPAQKGAELVRMVVQKRWVGTITEAVWKLVKGVLDKLSGIKVGKGSELVSELARDIEGVLGEARKAARAAQARRNFAIPFAPHGAHDIVDVIAEQGGIKQPPKGQRAQEFDDAPELRGIYKKLVSANGKIAPDEMASILHEQGLIPDGYASTMWTHLASTVQTRIRANAEQSARQAESKAQAAKDKRFDRDALKPDEGAQAIHVENLKVGDSVKIGGETLKVTHLDPDSYDVTLEDGKKYGVQEVKDGQVIYGEHIEGNAGKTAPKGDALANAIANPPAGIEPGFTHVFTTSKGSVYYGENFRTQRNKSLHEGHGKGDTGVKEKSDVTVYVHPELAREIGMWQSLESSGKRIGLDRHGKLFLVSDNLRTGKPGLDSLISPDGFSMEPKEGLAPVELWKRDGDGLYRGNHPGNEITAIRRVRGGEESLGAARPRRNDPNQTDLFAQPAAGEKNTIAQPEGIPDTPEIASLRRSVGAMQEAIARAEQRGDTKTGDAIRGQLQKVSDRIADLGRAQSPSRSAEPDPELANLQKAAQGLTERQRLAEEAGNHEVAANMGKSLRGLNQRIAEHGGTVETAGQDFALESPTDEQLKAEQRQRADRERLRHGAAKPLQGTAGDLTSDMFGEGETPLFNQRRDVPEELFADRPEPHPETRSDAGALEPKQAAAEPPHAPYTPTLPSSLTSAASRFKPRERVEFSKPLVGPSGAKLTAYEWQWQPEEYVDKRGEDRVRRVSDWTKAEGSAETGRDIVHHFHVEMPDGETRVVSAESVPVLLGYVKGGKTGNLPSLVSATKTLAKQRMKLAIAEAQKAENDKIWDQVKKLPVPEIAGPRPVWADRMEFFIPESKNARQVQHEPGEATKYTRDSLASQWQEEQAAERGYQRISVDTQALRKAIKKQEAKIAELTSSEPTGEELLAAAKPKREPVEPTPELRKRLQSLFSDSLHSVFTRRQGLVKLKGIEVEVEARAAETGERGTMKMDAAEATESLATSRTGLKALMACMESKRLAGCLPRFHGKLLRPEETQRVAADAEQNVRDGMPVREAESLPVRDALDDVEHNLSSIREQVARQNPDAVAGIDAALGDVSAPAVTLTPGHEAALRAAGQHGMTAEDVLRETPGAGKWAEQIRAAMGEPEQAAEEPALAAAKPTVEERQGLRQKFEGAHPVVMDEHGEPKTFYHGTTSADALGKSGKFDLSRAATDENLYGPGIYFTADPTVAGGDGGATKGYVSKGGSRQTFTFRTEEEADAKDAELTQQGWKILPGPDPTTFYGVSPEGRGIVPAHVRLERPLDMDLDTEDEGSLFHGFLHEDAHERLRSGGPVLDKLTQQYPEFDWDYLAERMESTASIANPTNGDIYRELANLKDENGQRFGKARLNQFLQELGYDGITHVGGNIMGGGHEHRVVIAFHPEQVYGKYGGIERKAEDPALFAAKPAPARNHEAGIEMSKEAERLQGLARRQISTPRLGEALAAGDFTSNMRPDFHVGTLIARTLEPWAAVGRIEVPEMPAKRVAKPGMEHFQNRLNEKTEAAVNRRIRHQNGALNMFDEFRERLANIVASLPERNVRDAASGHMVDPFASLKEAFPGGIKGDLEEAVIHASELQQAVFSRWLPSYDESGHKIPGGRAIRDFLNILEVMQETGAGDYTKGIEELTRREGRSTTTAQALEDLADEQRGAAMLGEGTMEKRDGFEVHQRTEPPEEAGLGAAKPKAEPKDEEPTKKGSTQVTLPPDQAKAFQGFAKSIPDADVYEPEPGEYGRELEPHVTALYGLTDADPEAVRAAVAGHGPVKFKLGKLSLFKNADKPYDVLKVDVDSPDLHALNAKLRTLPHESDFPDYHPHLTIAYLKKGAGEKYEGREPFKGREFTVPELTFSDAERNKTAIPLAGEAAPVVSREPARPDSPEVAALRGQAEGLKKSRAAAERAGATEAVRRIDKLIEGTNAKIAELSAAVPRAREAAPRLEEPLLPPGPAPENAAKVAGLERGVKSLTGELAKAQRAGETVKAANIEKAIQKVREQIQRLGGSSPAGGEKAEGVLPDRAGRENPRPKLKVPDAARDGAPESAGGPPVEDSFSPESLAAEEGDSLAAAKPSGKDEEQKGGAPSTPTPSGPVIKGGIARFYEGAADIFEKTPGLEFMGKAIRKHIDLQRRWDAQVTNPWRKWHQTYKRAERKVAAGEYESYWRLVDTGKAAEAAAAYAAASKAGRAVIDLWRKTARYAADGNAKLGVKEFDPTTKTWRATGQINDYVSRMVRPDIMEAIMNPARNPKKWEEVVSALIAEGHIKSRDEAIAWLDRTFPAETRTDFFSNIERARTSQLPARLYDYGFRSALKYMARWTERAAQISAYGQKTTAESHTLFDDARRRARYDQLTQEYITAVENRVYNVTPRNAWTKAMSILNSIATGSMLGNPLTSGVNLISGLAFNFSHYGFSPALKGAWEGILHPWHSIENAYERGILQDDLMRMTEDAERLNSPVAEKINQASAFMLKVTGYNLTEELTRAFSLTSAKALLRSGLDAMQTNPDGARAREFAAFAQRHGTTAEVLATEDGTGPQTDKFFRRAVNESQFGYRIDQTPVYANTPAGRFLTKFGKWNLQASRTFVHHVIEPLKGGDIRPFMRFAVVAAALGTSIDWLKEKLFGTPDRTAGWNEIAKTWDEDKRRAVALVAAKVWHKLVTAGSLGAFGNYSQMLMDVSDRTRFKNPLNPPGLAMVENFGELAFRLAEQGKLTADDINDWAKSQFSIIRTAQSAGARALDAFGADFRAQRIELRRQDLSWLHSVTRRFEDETTAASKTTSMGRVGKNPDSPFMRDLKESLSIGDTAHVMEMIRSRFEELPPALRKQEAERLKSSVAASRPIQIGGASDTRTAIFYDWAQRRLEPADVARIKEIDSTYRRTAIAIGLMQPMKPIPAKRMMQTEQKLGIRKAPAMAE